MNLHEQARAAVLEADEYMANHRVTDSWRVISRLHGALVRLMDEAATRTRVVSTVTELDALPMESIVLPHNGNAVQKGQGGMWWTTGWNLPVDVTLPARVLYDPEEDPRD